MKTPKPIKITGTASGSKKAVNFKDTQKINKTATKVTTSKKSDTPQWEQSFPKIKIAPTKYTPAELKQISAIKKKEAEARKTGTWKNGYTN